MTCLALTLFCAPAAAFLQQGGPQLKQRPAVRPTLQTAMPTPQVASVAAALAAIAPLPVLADEGSSYSQVSYYFVLALYILSFPGIVSLVTRSVKSKVVRKTYEVPGPAAQGGRATREVAGDIVAFFQANNYKITDAADVIVFEGVQAPVVSRAAFLTFCVAFALASLALVVTIVEQQALGEGKGLGNFWYLSILASPVAGKYYLDNAERSEQVSVKIVTEDDEASSDIIVQGDEEEVERFQKTLNMQEKGMVYVKGIFETE